jgi:hypothetical protein
VGPRTVLASGQRQTLDFFVVGFQHVSEPTVNRRELLYNASVLAHYAQVSTRADSGLPAPQDLSEVFDLFVADTSLRSDPEMMEMAGTHCLLLAGFFEDQMRGRHNIRWYAQLGSGFFLCAAANVPSQSRADMLETIGHAFEPWRLRYARLSRWLREQPYVLSTST